MINRPNKLADLTPRHLPLLPRPLPPYSLYLTRMTLVYHFHRFRRTFALLGAILLAFVPLAFILNVVVGSGRLANPIILSVSPAGGSHTAPITSSIVVAFDQPISPTSVNTATFVVHDMQTGLLTQTYGVSGNEIFLEPAASFWPGSLVEASVTTGTMNLLGERLLMPRVWRFRTAVACGSGEYADTLQTFGASETSDAAIGDLDGDNDLDVFTAQADNKPNKVWLNDGNGNFADSGQTLGDRDSRAVALGDLDGDGDLDAFVTNWRNQPNRVYFNDGNGNFTDSGQSLGANDGADVDLGDLDGDGDLDAVVVHGTYLTDKVWRNDGQGNFSLVQELNTTRGAGVALGDVDGDGDLDAFITTEDANLVFFNNGNGTFTDSGQQLGDYRSAGIGLGDLDGDGDLDAFIANHTDTPPRDPANRVWLNDGSGFFTDSGQTLGNSPSLKMGFGDVDGDGDLDAYVANVENAPNKLWLNDGAGNFSDSGWSQGNANSYVIGLADFDGNGSLDAWVGNFSVSDEVWLNLNIPIANLTAVNDSPTLMGNITTLSATVSAGSSVHYSWDLGDGMQADGAVITHTYAMAGAYTATVTATNCVNSLQASTTVVIYAPDTPTPTPSNTAEPTLTSTPTSTATPTPPVTPSATQTPTPEPQDYESYIPVVY